MKFEQAIVGIGLLSMMGLPMSVEAKDSKSITLKQIGRYSAGASTAPDEPRTEIAAYDPASKRLFSINLNLRQLDVLDLSNPESQVLSPVQTVPLGGKPNSVAVHDGIVAVAIEGPTKTDLGNSQVLQHQRRAAQHPHGRRPAGYAGLLPERQVAARGERRRTQQLQ